MYIAAVNGTALSILYVLNIRNIKMNRQKAYQLCRDYAEGRIYGNFDRNHHLVQDAIAKHEMDCRRFVDFLYDNDCEITNEETESITTTVG